LESKLGEFSDALVESENLVPVSPGEAEPPRAPAPQNAGWQVLRKETAGEKLQVHNVAVIESSSGRGRGGLVVGSAGGLVARAAVETQVMVTTPASGRLRLMSSTMPRNRPRHGCCLPGECGAGTGVR
jgi:hypothetical protein